MAKTGSENIDKRELTKEKLRQRKKEAKKNIKRARIVVKNIPFSATEELLREHFEKYGNIKEITVLKKENNQLVGTAFIQFELVQKAAKAIHYTNGKPFLDRNIIVEWAKPKDKYEKEKQVEQVKIKEEPLDDYDPNIKIKEEKDAFDLSIVKKEEPPDEQQEDENLTFEIVKDNSLNENKRIHNKENDTSNTENDIENISEEENQINERESDREGSDENSEENDSEDSDENDSEDDEKEEGNKNEEIEVTEPQKKPKTVSNDASEGKTVFIKNVPFNATNDDLAKCVSQFGPYYYALICIDRLTEHSKGTAFVKFKNKEDAEKCLDAKDLMLMGNVLDCQLALTKKELEQKTKTKKDSSKQSDSRNLYLVKEGVILAGSKAAEGVSESDMAKRLQLEQYKTQMLRNLNMFISKTRLVVHNLPLSWDDKKLRSLCAKHAGSKATIREARIMRDMRNVDANGVGKSKGFGFVTLTTHEDALNLLRSLNNNPNVFTPNKRPIVTFSIENRSKLKVKEKRMLNSKLKNPTYSKSNQSLPEKQQKVSASKGRKRKAESNENGIEEPKEFSGMTAKSGDLGFKKMRSNFHLKNQAKLHRKNLRQQKKIKKNAKKTLAEKKEEFTKQPKQKINKKKGINTDTFSKMVNEYKKKLISGSNGGILMKNKWYNSES